MNLQQNKKNMFYKQSKTYCKVRNINVEVILATLTSGSYSLILRSTNICSILYSNCVSSQYYTWSVNNHTYTGIHRHTSMMRVITVDLSSFIAMYQLTSQDGHSSTREFDKQLRGDTRLAHKI